MAIREQGYDVDCDSCWKPYYYRGGGNPLTDLTIVERDRWLLLRDEEGDPRITLCPECWKKVSDAYAQQKGE